QPFPLPIGTSGKAGVTESPEGSIINALNRNFRFGFVAGGLDDRGVYADFYDSDQDQYAAGLTAIIAPEQNRAAMFDALYRRSCYATTGERIIVGFNIAGITMGGETSTAEKHGLTVNRHISGYVAGTSPVRTVEIIRNGKVIHTIEPKETYHINFEYDDMTSIDKVTIDNKDKKPPFVYYYIRVTQEDGHIAWTSPIWVDYVLVASSERKAKRTTKPAKAMTAKESFGNDSDFALMDKDSDDDNENDNEDEEEDDDDDLLEI
ncbi:MAG: DUF3604 domain-containing protein, partial [Chlamydiota bacterium]